MAELVADCPRCKAKAMTHDLLNSISTRYEFGWKRYYEVFCVCRACKRASIFTLSQHESAGTEILSKTRPEELKYAVNRVLDIIGYISLKDEINVEVPEYLPKEIESAFLEGAQCLSINCPNASATMFRLCIDLATKPMLPQMDEEGLTQNIRRSLGLRLKWLFENNKLPMALKELAQCIKEDGNDGAHKGSLAKEDAEDIQDFTKILLERLFTEIKRIEIAEERRKIRRESQT
jgi:hypothetical protein